MAFEGMDVDQVLGASRNLKNQSSQITSLVAQIDKIVNGLTSVWHGADATRFVQVDWPQHKKNMQAVASAVEQLSHSAQANAQQQQQASR